MIRKGTCRDAASPTDRPGDDPRTTDAPPGESPGARRAIETARETALDRGPGDLWRRTDADLRPGPDAGRLRRECHLDRVGLGEPRAGRGPEGEVVRPEGL